MSRAMGNGLLLVAVLIIDAFAIAGLMGYVAPVVGAAVGLGAQVVGTIAFFVVYAVANRGTVTVPVEAALDPEPTYIRPEKQKPRG